MKARKSSLQPVNSKSDIPESFPSENAEREWWAEHELTDQFFAESDTDVWTHVANLEFQIARINHWFEQLKDENRSLKDRLDKLESKLAGNGS